MDVPGSRLGGDNPDNSYRVVAVDDKARFQIDGQRFADPPANVTFTWVGNSATSKTLNTLDGRDLKVSADGALVITVDPLPADGRKNHIHSRPGAKYLFIRDSLGVWKQSSPADYTVSIPTPTWSTSCNASRPIRQGISLSSRRVCGS